MPRSVRYVRGRYTSACVTEAVRFMNTLTGLTGFDGSRTYGLVSWSRHWVMGAIAIVPTWCSVGAYESASHPANSDAWPPIEYPTAAHDRDIGASPCAARTRSIIAYASERPSMMELS